MIERPEDRVGNQRNGQIHIRIFADGSELQEVRELLSGGPLIDSVLEVVKGRPRALEMDLPALPRGYLRRVPIRLASGEVLYLDTDRIDWLEASNQYVRLHTRDGHHLIRESMKQMGKKLDPVHFFRIHRSAIVNLSRVEKLRIDSPALRWVILDDGSCLRASPRSWDALQWALTWSP